MKKIPVRGDLRDANLDAICRKLEIDLLQRIGEAAREKIAPAGGILC